MFRSDSKHLCDVGLGYKTLAGNNYSKVQGSRFHAYADRSFTARWRWCIREYVGKMQSTLSQKLLWSLQFSKLKQAEKKKHALESEQPLGGKYSTHVHLRLHLSTNNSGTHFFCGEYSTRKNRLHHVSTFGLDARVRKCVTALQDWWRAFGEVKCRWLGSAGD